MCSLIPKEKLYELSIPLIDKPLKSFTLGKAMFTNLSRNSYIFTDLKVTLTPALAPFLVLKFEKNKISQKVCQKKSSFKKNYKQ